MWLAFSNPDFSISELKNKELLDANILNFVSDYLNDSPFITAKTSGSTGKPKFIELSKEAMRNSALATAEFLNLEQNSKALLCLSAEYIAGKMMLVRAIENKWDIYCVTPNSKPLENTNESFDFAAMVPLQAQNSLGKLKNIKTLIIGGAPVSSHLYHQLLKLDCNSFQTYGMTETVSHIAMKAIKPFETFYNCLPGITITVDDRDCLIIKAPKLADQPIVTNDVVVMIDEDIFEWLARYDYVINSGGVKIHPELVERKINPFLKERFFITSIPDDTLGQKVVMVVEAESQISMDFKTRLDKYEIPKEIVYISNFVETETAKIKRKESLDLALDQL